MLTWLQLPQKKCLQEAQRKVERRPLLLRQRILIQHLLTSLVDSTWREVWKKLWRNHLHLPSWYVHAPLRACLPCHCHVLPARLLGDLLSYDSPKASQGSKPFFTDQSASRTCNPPQFQSDWQHCAAKNQAVLGNAACKAREAGETSPSCLPHCATQCCCCTAIL
jgi:hypothetical protein